MRRIELAQEIAILKKKQAIKNAHLLHIENTTNWQGELYNSNRDALFEITEELDKKMDEYYFVCKTEIIEIDLELRKIQDALLADPFDYNALIVQEKEAKSKRLEIWEEMKSVLWVEDCTPTEQIAKNCRNYDLAVLGQIVGVDPATLGDGWEVKKTYDGERLVDWEIVMKDRIRRECEEKCKNPECLQTACVEHQKKLTEEVRKEVHNG
ncbi:hypothetical protein [Roseivirga sp. UBA1976]|uniref:hypothetical protein n=1 Tax=Roseivirga sp. UBA1976 TaxID=1947386 RepID=UPI00257E818D|nr:hypothetical protein [Roseivirga sp. UBA1976]|tara:strand:- start:10332 stop:10961 length:630 start_codon:yes stop_codon:yes gene_type:complete